MGGKVRVDIKVSDGKHHGSKMEIPPLCWGDWRSLTETGIS